LSKKVNIEKLIKNKPGNESKEHYLCKIAGFFYLYQQGCRIIGTELSGFMSQADYDRWVDRQNIEVTGKRRKKLENGICPFCDNKIEKKEWGNYKCIAYEIPKKKKYGVKNRYYERGKSMAVKKYDSLSIDDEHCDKEYWKKDGKWYRRRKSNSRNQIIDCAGIKRPKYNRLDEVKIRGIEAKASYNDFKSGFCTGADITYVIAPEGIIPKEEIPKYIGLLEVNIEELEIIVKPEVHTKGLSVKKRATTNETQHFYKSYSKKDRVLFLIEKVARRNTMDKIFGDYYPKQEE